MRKINPLSFLKRILFFIVLIVVIGCQQNSAEKINIAAAANMQFVMNDLVEKFTSQTGIDCNLIISSSGNLTSQIIEGAPFSIFVSADMKYPNELFDRGLTINKPKIYAYGKLVLWTMDKNIQPSLEILYSKNIKHIALPNPKIAPYGRAAEEVLMKQKNGTQLQPKFVYGESVAQTNQFIISQSAEIGFTSKSTVLSPLMKEKGNWIEMKDTVYSSIAQGVVVMNQDSICLKKAKLFYHFLFSSEAQDIFINSGYTINNMVK